MLLYIGVAAYLLGFLVVLGFAMWKLENKSNYMQATVAVFILYTGVMALAGMLMMVVGEPGLVVFAGCVVYSMLYVMYWALFSRKRESKKFSITGLLATISYLLAIVYVTMISREVGSNDLVQMRLTNLTETPNSMSHFILNLAMFVPFGFLAPQVYKMERVSLLRTFSFGLAASCLIELFQLVTESGICDVLDVLANAMGAFIGALACMFWLKMLHPELRGSAAKARSRLQE